MSENKKLSHNRRVFISKDDVYHKILSFNQHEDGSLYCSMPEFTSVKWMSFDKPEAADNPRLVIVDSPQEMGKLSMHGSGMLSFRSHQNPEGHTLIIKGNPLITKERGKIGVRHLFTYFPTEPKDIPSSPAFNRQSDYVLKKTGQLKPFVMIFFAIPSTRDLSVRIETSFHVDDLEALPPDVAFGTFGLRYHNVAWLYYRTKHMNNWPQHTHICYFDGYTVPMFVGTDQGVGQIELRNPGYMFEENELLIKI